MNLGPHADFIIAAYAIAALVIVALIAWIELDNRAQRRHHVRWQALDRSGGDRQANQRACRQIFASVDSSDGLAIRREYAGWRQRLIRLERILALTDELVIFVDINRADQETRGWAAGLATRLYEVPGKGYVEAHLREMFEACRCDWILRLDSDEQLSINGPESASTWARRSRCKPSAAWLSGRSHPPWPHSPPPTQAWPH